MRLTGRYGGFLYFLQALSFFSLSKGRVSLFHLLPSLIHLSLRSRRYIDTTVHVRLDESNNDQAPSHILDRAWHSIARSQGLGSDAKLGRKIHAVWPLKFEISDNAILNAIFLC